MPPFHVGDELDFILWVEKTLEGSGGHMETALRYELVEIAPETYAGVILERHIVRFWDGTKLTFDLSVDAELEPTKYSFDFRSPQGRLIWRKDMHIGHEEDAGLAHIHRGPEGEGSPERFDLVDLDEVIGEMGEYQRDGTIP